MAVFDSCHFCLFSVLMFPSGYLSLILGCFVMNFLFFLTIQIAFPLFSLWPFPMCLFHLNHFQFHLLMGNLPWTDGSHLNLFDQILHQYVPVP